MAQKTVVRCRAICSSCLLSSDGSGSSTLLVIVVATVGGVLVALISAVLIAIVLLLCRKRKLSKAGQKLVCGVFCAIYPTVYIAAMEWEEVMNPRQLVQLVGNYGS